MPSKASVLTNLERSRLVIWLLVVVVLLMSFMLAWQNVEHEANDTAFLVASKRMVERASYYKQQWLLSDQKAQIELDGKVRHFSKQGWLEPINEDNEVDCRYWLNTLYPEQRILGQVPIDIDSETSASDYQCRYLYGENRFISISLIHQVFSTKVGFLAN